MPSRDGIQEQFGWSPSGFQCTDNIFDATVFVVFGNPENSLSNHAERINGNPSPLPVKSMPSPGIKTFFDKKLALMGGFVVKKDKAFLFAVICVGVRMIAYENEKELKSKKLHIS